MKQQIQSGMADRPKTLFHGTAANYLPSFLTSKPQVRSQRHLERPAFCTSRSFSEGARFAFRNTPATDLDAVGIVLEFDASETRRSDRADVKDACSMFDEQEVAFFRTDRLKLVAIHRYHRGDWTREDIRGQAPPSAAPGPRRKRNRDY